MRTPSTATSTRRTPGCFAAPRVTGCARASPASSSPAAPGLLRCAAVHGLREGIVGFEFPADRGLAGRAISRGRPVLSDDYGSLPDAVPHPAYEGMRGAIVAPMRWSGEVMGILGVGSRDRARRFTQADSGLLEAFAMLAGLSVREA